MSSKKRFEGGSTIGVGYISIMLIFTVICLTILAVLGFQAVFSGSRVSERSENFTQEYYTADTAAKRTLAQLDEAALWAQQDFSFDESFISEAESIGGVTTTMTPDGVQAEYTVEINDRQHLKVIAVFHADSGSGRYNIIEWRSVTSDSAEESTPSVWDGNDIV